MHAAVCCIFVSSVWYKIKYVHKYYVMQHIVQTHFIELILFSSEPTTYSQGTKINRIINRQATIVDTFN